MQICTCTYMHLHSNIQVYSHYRWKHTCIHVHVHTSTCIHMYMYTYTTDGRMWAKQTHWSAFQLSPGSSWSPSGVCTAASRPCRSCCSLTNCCPGLDTTWEHNILRIEFVYSIYMYNVRAHIVRTLTVLRMSRMLSLILRWGGSGRGGGSATPSGRQHHKCWFHS